MWSLVIFVVLSTTFAYGQRGSRQGHGWDIRLAVPGEPGNDYPTLGRIPRTTFSCSGKAPGYYADVETNCQAFRVCTAGSTYGFQSFLCPNGTLFNQAVVVCDWWMNVNCQNSQQFIKSNDKFGNLKLGPQLMNDVKKMITHPMRNPYDKGAMKSNLIVMQEYRPPSGQLLPNSLYTPAAKLVQQNFINENSITDNIVAASTTGPFYIAPSNNLQATPQRNFEFFQKNLNGQYVQQINGQYFQQAKSQNSQSGQYFQQAGAQSAKYTQGSQNQIGQPQNGQFIQNTFSQNGHYDSNTNGQYQSNNQQTRSGTFVPNNHAGRIQSQQHYMQYSNNALQQTQNQNYNQGNMELSQRQVINNNAGYQRGPIRQNAQYTDNTINSQSNPGKQTEFGISFNRQQYSANQDKQNNAYETTIPQFSTDISGKIGTEAKQNLVSESYVPPTVITKTLTFNRIIQEPKPGAPKSRITFKTWIVKQPGKTAKLTQAEPTPYTYSRPNNSPSTGKLIVEPTPYYYNNPTTLVSQTQKIVSEPEPYYYNPPTVTTQTEKLISEPDGYAYNRPTTAAKQIISTAVPTLPSRLYLTPSPFPSPTVASRLYLAPTTFKPIARLYLPAYVTPPELSRQYLGPNEITQSDNLQSAKLQASPTTPITGVIVSSNEEKPTFSVVKQSRFNALRNNLTFADILTKEKLDITVNDIVKDTRNILGTAEPVQQFGQLREEGKADDYPENNYLTSESESFTESGENLTPANAAPTQEILKSSRLTQPASDLLPPLESHENDVQTTNKLATLPFFKETSVPTNTIERTVSLKISIPEKTAKYLFKTSNDSDFDKLEILNTGSSNYLVLTNKLAKSPTVPSFIPIGKLIVDNNSNLSDSQALVFSFLADSINQAKDIAQQNALTTTSHFQNINSEDLTKITNKVAQLTSSQYASNTNKNNQANFVSTAPNINSMNNQLGNSAKYTSAVSQNKAQKQANLITTAENIDSNNNNNQFRASAKQTNDVARNQAQKQTNVVSTDQNIISNNAHTRTSPQYTNKVSQKQANQAFTAQNSNNNKLRTSAKYTNNVPHNQAQQQQINSQQKIQAGQLYSRDGLNSINANLQINNDQTQLYSGQLYQVPVPDVTSIYNGQSSAKLISQSHIRQQNAEVADLHQNTNTDHNNKFTKQSSAEMEIVQSQTLPLPAPAKLQNTPEEPQSFSSQEDQSLLGNFVNPSNGIAAQLRDKIVGTIQHPLEENKLVTYKKDQSYYLYTKLDNFNNGLNAQSGIQQDNPQNAKLTQSSNADNNVVTFQLVPSVSYQLEDEKEQQRLLNTFQIDDFGNPKVNTGTSSQNVLTSNIDYTIQHTTPVQSQYNTLYTGPSSYSAPQASVGRLETLQRVVSKQNSNAAKLELEDNGYSKVAQNSPFTY